MKKDEFIMIAKLVEAHIQHSESYEIGITTGKFAERFDNAWELVEKAVALGDIDGSFRCPPKDRCEKICDECAAVNGLKQG